MRKPKGQAMPRGDPCVVMPLWTETKETVMVRADAGSLFSEPGPGGNDPGTSVRLPRLGLVLIRRCLGLRSTETDGDSLQWCPGSLHHTCSHPSPSSRSKPRRRLHGSHQWWGLKLPPCCCKLLKGRVRGGSQPATETPAEEP